MTVPDITTQRLHNQQITTNQFTHPAELVTWMGAVQAQDYAAAKWALGLRLQNVTDNDIEAAFNKGAILRTHLMRPTWHFVAPQDIRWLLMLTAPRVINIIDNSAHKLGLDEPIFKKSNKLIAKALLGGKHLTRTEMEAVLNKAGILTGNLHMIHLMMRAELDGLICSGPRKGKQFTYALLEERVPPAKKMDLDEARAELIQRYFISHGPATLQDFVWWSGLKTTDARAGLEMVKSNLVHETINGREYWFPHFLKSIKDNHASAYLLPPFDEYTVAYKDRSLLVDTAKVKMIPGPATLLSNTIVVDGRVAGTWKRTLRKDKVDIQTAYLHDPGKTKKQAIAKAAERYGKFHGLPVTITDSGA